jgi:Ca-activated chloride channel family protein
MNRQLSSRERKLLYLAGLAALTLAGHLVVGRIDARPSGASLPPGSAAALVAPALVAPAFGAPATGVGAGPVRLAARLDRGAVLAGAPGEVRLEVTLTGDRSTTAARRPTDFYVVLDRSGSMEGDKIEHARSAVLQLIDQLLPDDRFALVSYASEAQLDVALATAGNAAAAAGPRRWRQQVAAIEAGGGTAMSLGLDLALGTAGAQRPAGRAARLLLLSDGLANEGDSTPEGLAARARRAAGAGIPVSTLGVGADFNEVLMTALADVGLGNYYYLPNAEQIAAVLATELSATRETVAEELEVSLVPASGVRVREVAGYPITVRGERVVFHPGTLFAGQERRIWVTLETPAARGESLRLTGLQASYTSAGGRRSVALPAPLQIACAGSQQQVLAAIDRDAWGRAVVEEDFGRLQQEVAASVRAGHRDEALRKISDYEARNQSLNSVVQNAAVAVNLQGLDTLEAEVNDAFTGIGQEAKQNGLAKSRQATGYDARRAGAKKAPASSGGGH